MGPGKEEAFSSYSCLLQTTVPRSRKIQKWKAPVQKGVGKCKASFGRGGKIMEIITGWKLENRSLLLLLLMLPLQCTMVGDGGKNLVGKVWSKIERASKEVKNIRKKLLFSRMASNRWVSLGALENTPEIYYGLIMANFNFHFLTNLFKRVEKIIIRDPYERIMEKKSTLFW